MRKASSRWVQPDLHEACLLSQCQANFLGKKVNISPRTIWNSSSQAKLWLYNLHYFGDMNARLSCERTSIHRRLVERWIAENPIGVGVGWDPYPVSLRIVNWVKWLLRGNAANLEMERSIVHQVRWLLKRLEYHLLGNHLIANAKALCFAGQYFSGEEADRWFNKGLELLEEQLKCQVLEDGAHFELSPMYHLIVLEDLLDIVQLLNRNKIKTPRYLIVSIRMMLIWSSVMRHGDGQIPFFNDASFGVAATPLAIDGYAEQLNFELSEDAKNITHLKESGFVKIKRGNVLALCNFSSIGPDYLPGHSHAGTLSFELSIDDKRLVVNGGVSLYESGDERIRQRSTRSHSTLVLDGEDSSEIWGSFRVARRATVTNLRYLAGEDVDWVEAEHDGYRRLRGGPIHYRKFSMYRSYFMILDEVKGSGIHSSEIIVPLGPNLKPKMCPDGLIEVYDTKTKIFVCKIFSISCGEIFLEPTTWHPLFGVSVSTWKICVRFAPQELPLKHKLIIEWS